MNNTRQVLSEMRQAADAMSPKSGVRSALLKWADRLHEAMEQDVRLTESASEPRSAPTPPLTGVFDVQELQERQTWNKGRKQIARTRRMVERYSRKPWGHYPDLPGGA